MLEWQIETGKPMVHYLVFDIETRKTMVHYLDLYLDIRADKELVMQVYVPENTLTLDQAYDHARDTLLERSGQQSDFFPIPFHIPIAIATLQADENYRIRSLGCMGADRYAEADLITRFWQ